MADTTTTKQPESLTLQAPDAYADGSRTYLPDGTTYRVKDGQITGVSPDHVADLKLHGYTPPKTEPAPEAAPPATPAAKTDAPPPAKG